MSQWEVNKESNRRCRCTFLPVIKLVGVRVAYHHARKLDNEKGGSVKTRMELLRDDRFGRTGGICGGVEFISQQPTQVIK